MESEGNVRALLASTHEEERLQGLRELERSRSAELIPALIRAFGDESWRVRKEAVERFLSLPGSASLAGEIIELLHSEDNAGLRNTAVEVLVRLGRRAIPLLVEELSCSDHDVRKFVLDILGEIGDESSLTAMLASLSDEDGNVRAAAAENLGRIGNADAVPSLLAAMEHPDLWFRFTILEALGQIGVAVPMDELLRYKEDRLLRKALFDCLGRIGDTDAVPVLIEGLTDKMRNVREAAAVSLLRLGRKWPDSVMPLLSHLRRTPAVETISGLLDSTDSSVRHAAVQILGWIGDDCCAHRLLAALDEEELRGPAAASLVSLGAEAARRLAELWPAADDRTRTYLAYVFGETGWVEGAELLLDSLADADAELRLAAVQALGRLGGPEALGAVVECLGDDCEEVRQMATEALCRLGLRHRKQAVTILSPLLEHDEPQWRMHAVSILGRISPVDSVDYFTFAMKDESSHVRRAAVRALEGVAAGLQPLMLALIDEDEEVRRLAVEALGSIGGEPVVAPLELALQDEDIWVRSAAVRAIGNIPPVDAVRLAQAALADPVGLVVIAALESLVGLRAAEAHSALIHALEHRDEEVVNAALQLLASSERSDWIPRVRDHLLNHRHWEVRLAFARILAEIQGAACRVFLEERLLVEGEELVLHQLRDLLAGLEQSAEVHG